MLCPSDAILGGDLVPYTRGETTDEVGDLNFGGSSSQFNQRHLAYGDNNNLVRRGGMVTNSGAKQEYTLCGLLLILLDLMIHRFL